MRQDCQNTHVSKHTHQSEIEFPKDIPPTSCPKFESRVPSGYPPFLSLFPSPICHPPSLHIPLSISLCLSQAHLPFFVCPPQISLTHPRNHCFNISLRLSPLFMDLPPPRLIVLSLISQTQAFLCVSGLRGWNTNSQPTSHSKPKATGHGHPPTVGRHSRDFPSVCVCVSAYSWSSCLSFCTHISVCSQVCTSVCVEASVCLGEHLTV